MSFEKPDLSLHEELPEDRPLRIRNVSRLDKKVAEGVEEYIRNITRELRKAFESEAVSIDEALGEGAQERFIKLQEWIVEDFEEVGFPEIKLPPIHFMPEADESGESSGFATTVGNIKVFNTETPDKDIKQLEVLKIVAHEIYHGLAQTSIDVSVSIEEDEEKNSQEKINVYTRHGASYDQSPGESKRYAFEEGLATVFEGKMLRKLETLFPEGTVLKKAEEQPREELLQYYDDSRELAQYVASEIDNFRFLVEQARLENKTLPLARAVEKRFGKGAYRRLTAAEIEEAADVLNEFQQAQPATD